MMQNIRNGEPVVFNHNCPIGRRGITMNQDEYGSFLEEMVFQCFTFANIELTRLPKANASKSFFGKLLGKSAVAPIFRDNNYMSNQEICDYIVVKSRKELEDVISMRSDDYAEKYTISNKCFLKALMIYASNLDHPGEYINGDRYTIEISSFNLFPKQENLPVSKPLSDNDLVRIVGEAWAKLDADLLEPYLDKDFHYKSDPVFAEMSSRDEYLFYLRNKFNVIRQQENNERKVCNSIVEDIDKNKLDGIFLKIGYMDSVAYIEVVSKEGRITEMTMHESLIDPFSSQPDYNNHAEENGEKMEYGQNTNDVFSFDRYKEDFPKFLKIAHDYITDFFKRNDLEYGKVWSWMQTYPQEISFQHMCISYKDYVLCIVIGLYGEINGEGKLYVDGQYHENLIRECEKYNMTPCLFIIDCADGIPRIPEPYLTDARTHAPIDLSNLKEDNGGVMSEWEINNVGIGCVCDFLLKQGISKIAYCDVVGVSPQIWFEKEGEASYAFVRSVPAGLSSTPFRITKGELDKYSSYKGYFFDVQWNFILGNNGNFQDKRIFRQYNPWNLIHNNIDFKPIEEALNDFKFIEIIEGDGYEIKR